MSEELRAARDTLGKRLGGYQAIFNAIGDAVNTNAIGIGISVEAFLNALPDDAPALIDHLEADGGVEASAREVLLQVRGKANHHKDDDVVACMIAFARALPVLGVGR